MTENGAENAAPVPIPANRAVVYARPLCSPSDGWQELGYIEGGITPIMDGARIPDDEPAATSADPLERRDIVDEIDELVDWQMSNYRNRSGYDHNVNQDRCPHPWCHREWHGIAITRRIEGMRAVRRYDPDYRYNDDDSEVLCPGSTFTGEFTPPAPRRAEHGAADDTIALIMERLAVIASLPNPFLPNPWPIPDDPFGPRPGFIHVRRLLTLQEIQRIGWMRGIGSFQREVLDDSDHLAHLTERSAHAFAEHANRELGATVIDPQDVRVHVDDDIARWNIELNAGWQPETLEVELANGPHHGTVATVGAHGDRVYMMRPWTYSVRDYANAPTATDEYRSIEYRLDGWNPNTRRWIYRTQEQSA